MIADTGAIIAWLNREDQYHAWACELPQNQPWFTLESCLAEAAWNLGEPRKVAQLVELGFAVVVPLDGDDWRRVGELASRFADHEIDLVDFAVVRLSEKFRTEKIATVDREHFKILRRFRRERLPLLLPPD
jgi:predicted nucleic acid-binding protein